MFVATARPVDASPPMTPIESGSATFPIQTRSKAQSIMTCRSMAHTLLGNDRYRNDPYRAVLPPLNVAQRAVVAAGTPSDQHLPKITFAERKKVEVARGQRYFRSTTRYCFVRFKHESFCYLCHEEDFRNGDHVIVEGDRGENLGVIERFLTEQPPYNCPAKVIRIASEEEIECLDTVRREEAELLREIQSTVNSLTLSMSIEDVELQFDRNKMTIYYCSSGPVDFRTLQRLLFRQFRCRIWLVQVSDIHQFQ
jgi:hypothetical protein